jgi:hypothetical protein
MTSPVSGFEALFAEHRTASIPALWPWQREVLAGYESLELDAAVELPTGTGKTLIGLLAGEGYRQQEGAPVAYLAGNKQLAQQVERQARQLNFPVVRFSGSKESWSARDVRAYNFGQGIGVMNYWNYINANPGVEPAGLLILDDVHLLEQPLRDFFTVAIPRSDPLFREILQRVVARCPYYSLAEDLLGGVEPPAPPEMLVFPDSAELADEVRDLLDARLAHGSDPWWAWQQIRHRLEVCCWLVSTRAVTFTPYIPPAQTIRHFADPERRLYLSATIGSVEDLRRRLGTPPVEKLSASVQPRQGERLVVLRDDPEPLAATELIDLLRAFLSQHPKALWLCARRDTADALRFALTLSGLPGEVRILEKDNGADEPFAADSRGHLIAAGRYDGMDFPDEACRVEVLPEVPVATSDLEEWASAYLRDAGFAEARFSQRVAQALGRCNRSENDRAVYVLADPNFLTRFSQRRVVDALPGEVRPDVAAALERSDRGFSAGLEEAERFLSGEAATATSFQPPAKPEARPITAAHEVDGFLALWREDYVRSAELFNDVASLVSQTREYRAFWLAMAALALQLAGRFGDHAAAGQAEGALRAAASAGATSTFFTRLRLADGRRRGESAAPEGRSYDNLFGVWDQVIDRYGASGGRFDRWARGLIEDLRSSDHDTVARGIARFASELLGLAAAAPQATSGEHDAHWELLGPHRILAFEVKLAPTTQRVVNGDVEQAEGAVRALESQRSVAVRGLLVTPWADAEATALARLDKVRLVQRDVLIENVERITGLLREYRRGWSSEDAGLRAERRRAVEARLPELDWFWKALERAQTWVGRQEIDRAWPGAIDTVSG